MTRRLEYITVEIGPCAHCFRGAGDHAIDGLCGPMGLKAIDPNKPRPCYRGRAVHAFLDLDERIAEVDPVELVV